MRTWSDRGRGCVVLAALVLAASAGCGDAAPPLPGLGDPEPAASAAPIEIVLATCALNRPSVVPGTHEVILVGAGAAVLTASTGQVLATVTDSGTPVTTSDDDYTITCRPAGGRARQARLDSRG